MYLQVTRVWCAALLLTELGFVVYAHLKLRLNKPFTSEARICGFILKMYSKRKKKTLSIFVSYLIKICCQTFSLQNS